MASYLSKRLHRGRFKAERLAGESGALHLLANFANVSRLANTTCDSRFR